MKICIRCRAEFEANRCPECQKVRNKKYKELHKERLKVVMAIYIANNKDKIHEDASVRNKINYQNNKEAIKLKQRMYLEKNREVVNARKAVYRTNNKDKIAVNNTQWQNSNKEKVQGYKNKWSLANPEKRAIIKNNRRARILAVGGVLSSGLYERLFILQKGICIACKCSLKKGSTHLDHIKPISRGGSNTDDNIQLLCQPCNNSKGAKDPLVFMQSRGFLI